MMPDFSAKPSSLEIAGTCLQPGEKKTSWATLCPDFDAPLRVPMLLAHGVRPGPVLYLVSGLYGDEYTGMEAIHRLFDALDPSRMSGSVLAVPMLNIPAFHRIDRVGDDLRNMNRVGAGDPCGELTERIVDWWVREIADRSDYGIELIDIGLHYTITSFVALVEAPGNPVDQDFVHSYGCDLLWTGSASPQVLRRAMAERGKKVFMTELGGQGRALEADVAQQATGLEGVVHRLGIDPGLRSTPSGIDYRRFSGFWIRANCGGIFRCRVRRRQEVREGEVLATIHDLLGNTLETIVAPYDGIMIGYRTTSRIRPGDWSLWVGRWE